MQVRRNGHWLSVMMGAECAMMSTETGNYVTVSSVGARIWDLTEKPIDLSALCARLVEEFDVDPRTCLAEVEVFLDELKDAKAVILERSPRA